jgi:hypothetical protein
LGASSLLLHERSDAGIAAMSNAEMKYLTFFII